MFDYSYTLTSFTSKAIPRELIACPVFSRHAFPVNPPVIL